MPAINRVGELFDCGRYFLPQLISGAEAMKLSIGVLEPYLQQDENREKLPVVVLATVKGDIHDIGQKSGALMMKNYGFQVIDLGKDVPAEDIIRTAKENNAALIGLSALMTTTHAGNEACDPSCEGGRADRENHHRRRGDHTGICG